MIDTEKLEELAKKTERLELQMARLVSDQESEKDTRARVNQEIMKLITDHRNEIMNLIYGNDRKSGLIVDVDRLNHISGNIIWLWRAVAVMFLGVISYIIKDNIKFN